MVFHNFSPELKQRKVTFIPEKPHTKGIINNISFMPWSDACFVTGGSDHAVIIWEDKDDSWKTKRLHKDFHSSAVTGVTGLQQKNKQYYLFAVPRG